MSTPADEADETTATPTTTPTAEGPSQLARVRARFAGALMRHATACPICIVRGFTACLLGRALEAGTRFGLPETPR
jgi:hypothetical protein